MSEQFAYIFVGVVHPTRGAFNLSLGGIEIEHKDTGSVGKFDLAVIKGHATVRYSTNVKPENLGTVRNIIQDAASIYIDLYCLDKIRAYTLDLFQVTDIDSFETLVFGNDRPVSRAEGPPFEFDLDRTSAIAGRLPLFRRALIDYRRAIADPAESGFLCYRAFESVIQQYKNDLQTEDKKAAVAVLSKDITLSNASANFLWDSAGDVRHGKVKFVSGDDADKALTIARSTLIRFAAFRADNTQTWDAAI
jgi:hypothetical protein